MIMMSEKKFKALEIGKNNHVLRLTYRFWRRVGLARLCSLRFALSYRLGILR
jgi:hypothetical protein